MSAHCSAIDGLFFVSPAIATDAPVYSGKQPKSELPLRRVPLLFLFFFFFSFLVGDGFFFLSFSAAEEKEGKYEVLRGAVFPSASRHATATPKAALNSGQKYKQNGRFRMSIPPLVAVLHLPT